MNSNSWTTFSDYFTLIMVTEIIVSYLDQVVKYQISVMFCIQIFRIRVYNANANMIFMLP